MVFDPQLAARHAAFVQFVYNMYATNNADPKPAVDPGLAEAGYEFLSYLNANDLDQVKFYGYLAASTSNPGDLLLAIRGTQGTLEWILDFDAIPLPYLNQGYIAAGFRSIAETFNLMNAAGVRQGKLTPVLLARHAAQAISSITVLGHSLGGALATLAAAEIAFSSPVLAPLLQVWTYASPKVGLSEFVDAYNKAVPNTFRLVNSLDIVPLVPPFPYTHVNNAQDLSQTAAQISHLSTKPLCEHHLSTYQWLLDPPSYLVDATCQVAPPAATSHVLGGAPVSERALGAEALAQGLARR